MSRYRSRNNTTSKIRPLSGNGATKNQEIRLYIGENGIRMMTREHCISKISGWQADGVRWSGDLECEQDTELFSGFHQIHRDKIIYVRILRTKSSLRFYETCPIPQPVPIVKNR